jgi:hypothetical protein
MRRFSRLFLLLLFMTTALSSCIIMNVRKASLESVPSTTQRITTPAKVYLSNGAIVLFRSGAELRNDTLWAIGNSSGAEFFFPDSVGRPILRVPLDSVAAMEAVQMRSNAGLSIMGTLVSSTLAGIGGIFLYAAIFGSCPTVYTDSAGQPVLDAEVFANRISALYEARDLDLLKAQPNAQGVIRLEIRNEALETHYINVFELLETEHQRDETVVLDERGKPIAVKAMLNPARALDARTRDVTADLNATDGVEFATSMPALLTTSLTDFTDHIDLTFPNDGSAETALTMRVRNSVLNSVLLYDVIMNEQGLHAVDWLGVYMERIGSAVEFARWHHSRFGLRVSVWQNGAYQEVARHPTYGPIAWREVATMLPRVAGDSLRVRLSFVKDDWRIDRVSLARSARRAPVKRVVAERAIQADGARNHEALHSLRQPDDKYVQTYPGHRFFVEFDVAKPNAAQARTYLLASHGFYTEWVRGTWLQNARPTTGFQPSDIAIVKAIDKWRGQRESLTRDFFSKRVPVM